MLYTRISRKSQVNSFIANARFIRNIGTLFILELLDAFSSILMTTCFMTIYAMLLFSVNIFHSE